MSGEPQAPHGIDRFGEILLESSRRQPSVVRSEIGELDWLDDLFTIRNVEPGLLWLLGLDDPLAVPEEASAQAQPGWELRATLARRNGRWHLVEIDAVWS